MLVGEDVTVAVLVGERSGVRMDRTRSEVRVGRSSLGWPVGDGSWDSYGRGR